GSAGELALFVIHHFFIKSLAQRLHNAAVHLSMHQQRIDLLATIVYRDVTLEVDLAGFRIDLYYGDVGSEREGEILWFKEGCGRKARLHVWRDVLGQMGGKGHFLNGDCFARGLRLWQRRSRRLPYRNHRFGHGCAFGFGWAEPAVGKRYAL